MRVIKQPEHEITCIRCGALIGLTPDDLERDSRGKIHGDTLYFFTCPCCHEHHGENAASLPPWMINKLDK